MKTTELILISISGKDRPGVTAALTGILGKYETDILDIGQADIHHNLSLGILFRTTSDLSGEIMKELFFKANEIGVEIRYTPIPQEEYAEWVSMQGKHCYIITVLGRTITAKQISAVSDVIRKHDLNIDSIKRLTGRIPLTGIDSSTSKACIRVSVRGFVPSDSTLPKDLMSVSRELDVDISLQ